MSIKKQLQLNKDLLDFDIDFLINIYTIKTIEDSDELVDLKNKLLKLKIDDLQFFILYCEYNSYSFLMKTYGFSKFKIHTELKRIKELLNN